MRCESGILVLNFCCVGDFNRLDITNVTNHLCLSKVVSLLILKWYMLDIIFTDMANWLWWLAATIIEQSCSDCATAPVNVASCCWFESSGLGVETQLSHCQPLHSPHWADHSQLSPSNTSTLFAAVVLSEEVRLLGSENIFHDVFDVGFVRPTTHLCCISSRRLLLNCTCVDPSGCPAWRTFLHDCTLDKSNH